MPLDQAIVLAGREKAATDFTALLATGRSVISLGGDIRLDDACAFIAAALEKGGALDSTCEGVRTLFVSDATSLAQLVAQPQPLILVLADPGLARDLPTRHGHQLVVTAPPGGQGDVEVPRIHGQVVETQLQSAGLTRDEAVRLGTLGRRSLLALRRALAHQPVLLTPSWATTPDVIRRRLLLLGSWNGENQEDRRIVSECIGLPYEQVQEHALQLAAGADIPFVGRVEEIWHLLAAEDAWTLLGATLTKDDLDALRGAVVEVLSELNPVLDLDPDERWKAGISGVKWRFSPTLRSGLAQSLALLGAGGPGLHGPGGLTASQWVRMTVQELFTRANADDSYRLWASLSDVLCLLAEAAPDAFMKVMEDGLNANPPLHAAMFSDNAPEKFGMGNSSPHTAFLWALETLAWSSDYLCEAVDVLAALSAVDPGGRLSNRPMASLVGILSAWSPNTSADVDGRIRAIERVVGYQPAIGQKMLLHLIPGEHAFQDVHPGPRFRDWKKESPVTHRDVAREVNAVVELLIKGLDSVPERYLDLIGKVDVLSPEHRSAFATRLASLGGVLADEDQRALIFDALRERITKHREYSDAQWALPEDELRELQAACDALEPVQPVRRHAWLFNSDWVTLGDRSRREDFAAYDAEVLRRRAVAVNEVIADGGLEAVITLASATKYPYLVGNALAEQADSHDLSMLAWLESDLTPHRDVASAYLGRRLRTGGDLLTALLTSTHDALAQARVLRFSPEPATAWPKLAELGLEVTEHYWREFIYFGLGSDFPQALEAAWSLLDARRPAAALDLIMLYGLKQDTMEAAEVVATGLEHLLQKGLNDPEVDRLDTHSFEQLFALLARYRDEIGRQRVVHLEWQLFPALGFEPNAPTLHRALTEEPSFFVELVTRCFRPAASVEEDPDDPAQLEQRRALATRAYEVLRSFRRCPGVTAVGELDATALRDWVTNARAGLEAADRLEIGDGQIGEILSFAPSGPDGSIIHEVVRELLEDVRSDAADRGLGRGIRNKRGVTSRGLLDGGSQEWALAHAYAEQAKMMQAWPRTRKILAGLAEAYGVDARREDQSAERRHQGLGG